MTGAMTGGLTSGQADVIGLVGSAAFIGAYAYATFAASLNKLVFNAVNLVGSVLLLISLSVNFNLAAFALESAWGVIAAVGLAFELWRRLRRRRRGPGTTRA